VKEREKEKNKIKIFKMGIFFKKGDKNYLFIHSHVHFLNFRYHQKQSLPLLSNLVIVSEEVKIQEAKI
jgi:hypothetical protein